MASTFTKYAINYAKKHGLDDNFDIKDEADTIIHNLIYINLVIWANDTKMQNSNPFVECTKECIQDAINKKQHYFTYPDLYKRLTCDTNSICNDWTISNALSDKYYKTIEETNGIDWDYEIDVDKVVQDCKRYNIPYHRETIIAIESRAIDFSNTDLADNTPWPKIIGPWIHSFITKFLINNKFAIEKAFLPWNEDRIYW